MKNTLDEQIEILIAYRDGKQIQVKHVGFDSWDDRNLAHRAIPEFCNYEYRIKPEAKELYIVSSNKGLPIFGVHKTYADALKASEGFAERTIARFIEDIE